MRKYLLSITFVLMFCSFAFASENLNIVKKGKQSITFDPIEVTAGSIEAQVIIVKSGISKIFTNIIGFADIGGSYGQYKKAMTVSLHTLLIYLEKDLL